MRYVALALALAAFVSGCSQQPNPYRVTQLRERQHDPDRYVPADLDKRSDSAALANPRHVYDTDEESNHDSLPAMPFGMTVAMIRDGDALYRGKGGCVDCHGTEEEGLAARGKILTTNIHFVGEGDWQSLDSLILVGMDDDVTRTTVPMPPRGKYGNLTADETKRIAAYIWAVSQVKGEPWEGGHSSHTLHNENASARSAIP